MSDPDETRSQAPALATSAVSRSVVPGDMFVDEPERYAVEGQIGSGGMGTVLAAKGSRLGRPVALKVVSADREDLLRRFEREAQVTARLQHPAIVPVYGAGRRDGLPFYAMKHVTGDPLDKVIDAAANVAERIALVPKVLAVTEAIAYAHAERVIHRDLKPANILVGAFGETVVIDWGLAKDLRAADDVDTVSPYRASGDETSHGNVMGTPAYMPLEQARGEAVDEHADVYALGAILYHVLAGRAPYKKSADERVAWESMLARVLAGPPSPLPDGIPAELVAIVARAMARNPADRYPSAGELAADLRRFQAGQLVGAHRYSTWQLVKRWLRRHRTAVIVGAVAFGLLAIGGIASVREILAERDTANEQRAIAEQRSREAEERRIGAQKIANYVVVDLGAKLKTLGKLDLLAGTGHMLLDYYDSLTIDDDQPKDLVTRSNTFVMLQIAEEGKGNFKTSVDLLEHALTLDDRLIALEPNNAEWWSKKANSLATLSSLYRNHGLVTEHAKYNAAALDAAKAAHTLAPKNRNMRRAYAVALVTNAAEVSLAGHPKEALAPIREALPLFEAATRDGGPDDFVEDNEDLLTARGNLLDVLIAAGELQEALATATSTAGFVDELRAKRPDAIQFHYRAINAYINLGDVQADRGDHAAALAAYLSSRKAGERVLQIEPARRFSLDSYYLLLSRIANELAALGRTHDAEAALAEALALDQAWLDHNPTNGVAAVEVSLILKGLADLDRTAQRWSSADDRATRAASLVDKTITTAGPEARVEWRTELAELDLAIGQARLELGRRDAAEAALRKGLGLARELATAAPDSPQAALLLAEALTTSGRALVRLGKPDGTALLAEAVSAADASRARFPSEPKLGGALVNALGAVADGQDASAARATRTRALAVLDELLKTTDDRELRAAREEVAKQLK